MTTRCFVDKWSRRFFTLHAAVIAGNLVESWYQHQLISCDCLVRFKVIEEQSGLVEVAKRKVSKMVKEVAEERRRRKECEKRFTDEKQDLREQNELLEFRLLELDAWKQQVCECCTSQKFMNTNTRFSFKKKTVAMKSIQWI